MRTVFTTIFTTSCYAKMLINTFNEFVQEFRLFTFHYPPKTNNWSAAARSLRGEGEN